MKLITGMHRSGTSITARLFFEAGADLGDPDTFYPGDRWNPDGYFEQPDFHSINMPLINGLWGKFSYFKLPTEKTILYRSKRFSKVIPEIAEKYKGKIVKETRFSLTYPAWSHYGTEFQKALINIREPIQVAYSLKKRNHIPIWIGLKLWYEHNSRIFKYTENIPRFILNYNKLLNSEYSFSVFKEALMFMEIDLPDKMITEILKSYLKPSMNHNQVAEYNYNKNIRDLWKIIQHFSDKDSI